MFKCNRTFPYDIICVTIVTTCMVYQTNNVLLYIFFISIYLNLMSIYTNKFLIIIRYLVDFCVFSTGGTLKIFFYFKIILSKRYLKFEGHHLTQSYFYLLKLKTKDCPRYLIKKNTKQDVICTRNLKKTVSQRYNSQKNLAMKEH